ncbi:MAG: hypothetical protein GC151_13830 [Betaproteobacteria bacterium]|nr:hypothetical protein [Betaproteobacteria bacterium]
MAIDYIEKGEGMHRAIRAAGLKLEWVQASRKPGEWVADNEAAVQAIIYSYDPLPDVKGERVAAIKADGLARMQAAFPAIRTLEDANLLGELWQSIAPAARKATAKWQYIVDVYTAAATAIASVRAATSVAEVAAVTVNWPAAI